MLILRTQDMEMRVLQRWNSCLMSRVSTIPTVMGSSETFAGKGSIIIFQMPSLPWNQCHFRLSPESDEGRLLYYGIVCLYITSINYQLASAQMIHGYTIHVNISILYR